MKVLEALRFGVPLSVTRTVMGYEFKACACAGFHVKTPVAGSIAAPSGTGGTRLKVSFWGGRSVAVAATPRVRRVPAGTAWLGIALKTGGVFVARDNGSAGSDPNSISVRSK